MALVTTDDGVKLWYQLEGSAGAPVLVLSNSLGTTLSMWDPQMSALLQSFQVLRYDTRGHGQSGLPPQPYRVDRLGRDVVALLDACGLTRAHFCGLSMGGMTGMWLGREAPARIDRLVLCNTSALIGPADIWDKRMATVRGQGMDVIVPGVIERWFTKPFVDRDPAAVERIAAMLRGMPVEGYALACQAIRDMDQRDQLATITAKTLVIAGAADQATPAVDGRLVADHIPGARFVELAAAHLSNIEAEKDFTAALTRFLTA